MESACKSQVYHFLCMHQVSSSLLLLQCSRSLSLHPNPCCVRVCTRETCAPLADGQQSRDSLKRAYSLAPWRCCHALQLHHCLMKLKPWDLLALAQGFPSTHLAQNLVVINKQRCLSLLAPCSQQQGKDLCIQSLALLCKLLMHPAGIPACQKKSLGCCTTL